MAVQITPTNRAALWSKLALNKTQLAELGGVTTRQISHWTGRGYLLATGETRDTYNGAAIDLVVLIKQGLDAGLPLRLAVSLADTYLADTQAETPGLDTIEPATLQGVAGQLRRALAQIGQVREVVDPLVPREVDAARENF